MMGILLTAHSALSRRLALHRAGVLAREAALVLRQRNQAPPASLRRMGLTARAIELNCLSAAAAAEAVGDEDMVIEHRVEAAWFGKRARLHALLSAPA